MKQQICEHEHAKPPISKPQSLHEIHEHKTSENHTHYRKTIKWKW